MHMHPPVMHLSIRKCYPFSVVKSSTNMGPSMLASESGRHLVAYDIDSANYDAILAPLP